MLYEIITALDTEALSRLVSYQMKRGYAPIGGVCYVSKKHEGFFAQVMTAPANKTEGE